MTQSGSFRGQSAICGGTGVKQEASPKEVWLMTGEARVLGLDFTPSCDVDPARSISIPSIVMQEPAARAYLKYSRLAGTGSGEFLDRPRSCHVVLDARLIVGHEFASAAFREGNG
jgi:hypothetical protein